MMPAAAAAAAAAAREALCSVGRGVAVECSEEKVRHDGYPVKNLSPVTILQPGIYTVCKSLHAVGFKVQIIIALTYNNASSSVRLYGGKLSREKTRVSVQNENFEEKAFADCSGPIIM